jgi:hypothetical protein
MSFARFASSATRFPAENHSADSDGIDIVTAAGVGPIRGGFSTRVRDSMLGGSNPFVDIKAPERTQNFDVNLGGAIVPNKSSFSIFAGGRKQFDTPVATYSTITGDKVSTLLGPASERRLERQRDVRLRADQAAHPARRLLAELFDAQQSWHRRLRSRGTRVCERDVGQSTAAAGGRTDRQGHVPEHAVAAAPLQERFLVAARGADHSRASTA